MSEKYIPEVYCVYLPTALNNYLSSDKLDTNLNRLWQLEELAKLLPLEDVFFLVYNQTKNDAFTRFTADNDLFNVLSHPKNISWMKEMETKYIQYLQKNNLQVVPSGHLDKDPFMYYDTYPTGALKWRQRDANVVIFYDAPIIETDGEETKEILHTRRMTMADTLYDLLGRDTLRTHPVAKALFVL